MVLLDFQLDEARLREDVKEPIEEVDAGTIGYTFFVMPVRLTIDSVDLLEEPMQVFGGGTYRHPWLPLPLLHVATVGLECVKAAESLGRTSYDLPDVGARLEFQFDNGSVEVRSGQTSRRARCSYIELVGAFGEFAERVRKALRQKAPAVLGHPRWGEWLRGGTGAP